MNRLFLLYLAGLVLRSLILGALGTIVLIFSRRVEFRHAVWAVILLLIALMPIADQLLPRTFVPPPIPEIIIPIQTFIIPAPQSTAQPVVRSERSQSVSNTMDWWPLAVILMGSVTLAFLTRFAFGLRQVVRIRRASQPIENALWNEWRQRHDAVLAQSDQVRVPFTVGFRKPFVILPSGWQSWEDSKLRHVLMHEWTHVTRRDWAIASFAAFVKCMFWFNPLVWWIEKRLSSLSEQASDEASVRFSGDPQGYAETLLQFAAAARQGDRWIGGVTMAQHKISQRIERVLAFQRPGRGVLSRTAWVALVVMSLPVLYLSAASQVAQVSPAIPGLPVIAPLQFPITEPAAPAVSPALATAVLQAPAPPADSPAVATAVLQAPVLAQPAVSARAVPPPLALQNPTSPGTPVPGVVNPDLVGEIRLILTPVDSPVAPGQVQLQTNVWTIRNTALDPNTWANNNAFAFVLTGIQARTLQFEGPNSGSFSYGCPNCAFVVWESGVGLPAANTSPGIVFQLSSDGKRLTATCRAAECQAVGRGDLVQRVVPLVQIIPGQAGAVTSTSAPVLVSRLTNSESWTFPVLRDSTGIRSCFSVFGSVKADGTPFTDADCPSSVSVGPTSTITFSVRR